jgi:fermentation-respiration switch protein FrsA (DUF1100 family)
MKHNILRIICIAFLTMVFSGCARLDDNFFNPNHTKITEYKFNNYTGETDFRLDATFTVPDNLIKLFTLQSQAPGESAPTTIYAVYIGDITRIATDTVIMYCHGNKDHMDFYWQRAQLLANTRGKNHYGVMMVDYRGYGLSQGKPTEDGLYADVNAALLWLQSKGVTNNRLMMYGFSLGTAPSVQLTAHPRSMIPAKLLLEAPFASAENIVQDATGLSLKGDYFTNLKINNAEQITFVQQPFFWIHGLNDDFVDYSQGQAVFNNYRGLYREAHPVAGAAHSNVPNTLGFQNYLKAVGDFIVK